MPEQLPAADFNASRRKEVAGIVFLLLAGILLSALRYTGIILSDNYCYYRYATDIAEGTFSFNSSIASHRLGLILPMAAVIRLLGTGTAQAIAVPMAAYLLLSLSVYVFLRRHHPEWRWAGMAFVIFNPGLTILAGNVWSDIPGLLFMTLSVFLLYEGFQQSPRAGLRLGILAGTCWFAGLLARENALFLIPFFFLLAMYALLKDRNRLPLIIGLGLSVLAWVGLWLLMYKVMTGDAFMRMNVVDNEHNSRAALVLSMALGGFLGRITWVPPVFFLTSIFSAVPVFFGLLWMYAGRARRDFSFVFWTTLSVSLLLIFWFGSTSLHQFLPLPMEDRMMVTLLIPLFVAAPAGFSAWVSEENRKQTVIIASLVALVSLITLLKGNKPALISLILSGFVLGTAYGKLPQRSRVFTVFVFVLLAGYNLLMADRKKFYAYPPAESRFLKSCASRGQGSLILTDCDLYVGYPAYYHFRNVPKVSILPWVWADEEKVTTAAEVWLIRTGTRGGKMIGAPCISDIPPWMNDVQIMGKPVEEDVNAQVQLYRIDRDQLLKYLSGQPAQDTLR